MMNRLVNTSAYGVKTCTMTIEIIGNDGMAGDDDDVMTMKNEK
jgi:hypothetical protein